MILGIIIGLIFGVIIGIFTMCLCITRKQTDEIVRDYFKTGVEQTDNADNVEELV